MRIVIGHTRERVCPIMEMGKGRSSTMLRELKAWLKKNERRIKMKRLTIRLNFTNFHHIIHPHPSIISTIGSTIKGGG